jgi:hypothetical protein
MWPELAEARKKSINISREIEHLFKEQRSLMKRDIAAHKEKLITETDDSISLIERECKEILKSLKMHRKSVEAKSNFLRRHNRIKFK